MISVGAARIAGLSPHPLWRSLSLPGRQQLEALIIVAAAIQGVVEYRAASDAISVLCRVGVCHVGPKLARDRLRRSRPE